ADNGRGFLLQLVGGALLAHHVDRPARQFGAQAHVLTITADGLGQVVLGHGHVHGVAVLVDNDGGHLGGCHGIDDQLRGVLVPQNDVDALIGQLATDYLHARATHAHAGTDRVDALVIGFYGDLGTRTGITRGGLD